MNDDKKGKRVLTAEEQLEEEEKKRMLEMEERKKKALALWEEDKDEMISSLKRVRESRMKILNGEMVDKTVSNWEILNGEMELEDMMTVSKYSDIAMKDLDCLMDYEDELYDLEEMRYADNDEMLEKLAIRRKFMYDAMDEGRDRALQDGQSHPT